MIYSYEYELSDGTIVYDKPTDPEAIYTTWVNLIAPQGYILKNKYNSDTAFNLRCTLNVSNFWEVVPQVELN